MGGRQRAATAVIAGAIFIAGFQNAEGQVVAEPALITAGFPGTETFKAYLAFPANSYVLGGMIRFPLSYNVDIGGRAGLWFIDDGDDTPFAGGDVRFGLLARPLSSGGGMLNLSFDVGLGVSEPGPTVWKIPVGFPTGIGFSLSGGASEVFAFPRIELGASSGEDDLDIALLLDLGGQFAITPTLSAMLDIRFGNGLFEEGSQIVPAVAAAWRL